MMELAEWMVQYPGIAYLESSVDPSSPEGIAINMAVVRSGQ